MAAVWRSQSAFIRLFNRKTGQMLNNASGFGEKLYPESLSVFTMPTRNYSRYSNSPFVERVEEKYEYEIVKNPSEWTYVTRLLPFNTIPAVTPKETYSSGWTPPKEEAKDLPYFISRTKNHMLPIYLNLKLRGTKKISMIKKINGDIWLLNEEIRSYLCNKHNKYIQTRVHELACMIEVKGDYVLDLQDWAHSKGF